MLIPHAINAVAGFYVATLNYWYQSAKTTTTTDCEPQIFVFTLAVCADNVCRNSSTSVRPSRVGGICVRHNIIKLFHHLLSARHTSFLHHRHRCKIPTVTQSKVALNSACRQTNIRTRTHNLLGADNIIVAYKYKC